MLTVTLKSLKQNFVLAFLKPAIGGNVFFDFFKQKDILKKLVLLLFRSKKVLPIFEK